MKFRRILIPFLIIALAVGVVLLLQRFRPKPETKPVVIQPPVVEVQIAQPESITLSVNTQGTAQPKTVTNLVPQVGGRIVKIADSFEVGGHIEEGTPLIEFEKIDYEFAIAQASQEVAQVAMLLAEEEARAKQAAKDWKELGRGEAPPLALREPQLEQARAAKRASEAALATAQRDLERTTLYAPYDGRVTAKDAEVGEFKQRGNPVGRIYDDSLMEVALPLGQDELSMLEFQFTGTGRLAEPIPVRLTARFGSDRVEWEGRIRRTSAAFDERSRTLELIAEVTPEGGETPLLPGQFVTARIEGRRLDEAFKLPRVALQGFDRVLVVTEDDTLTFREVTTVSLDPDHVAVTDGLKAGERVCITPLQTATEGMKVRVEFAGEPETPPS